MNLVVSNNVSWEVALFQKSLIDASTMDDLLAVKNQWREQVRIKAMDAWKRDEQYLAFEAKVKRLKRKQQLLLDDDDPDLEIGPNATATISEGAKKSFLNAVDASLPTQYQKGQES